MTEHNNDPKDDEIRALYREASTQQPSATMDDAILSAAHAAVEPPNPDQAGNQSHSDNNAKPKAAGPFSRQWAIPASLAAVIVLSVSLVTTIQLDAPDKLTSAPEMNLGNESVNRARNMPPVTPAPAIVEKAVRDQKYKQTEANKKEQKTATLSEQDIVPSQDVTTEIAQTITPQTKAKRKNPQPPALAADIATTQGSATAIIEPAAEEASIAAAASAPETLGKADSGTAKASARLATPSTEKTITEDCPNFSELDCIGSGQCTLILQDRQYQCRPAQNHCEQGFAQLTDNAEQCKLKPHCEFVPGICYCPPGVSCLCGGGDPRMCVPQEPK